MAYAGVCINVGFGQTSNVPFPFLCKLPHLILTAMLGDTNETLFVRLSYMIYNFFEGNLPES